MKDALMERNINIRNEEKIMYKFPAISTSNEDCVEKNEKKADKNTLNIQMLNQHFKGPRNNHTI